MTIPISVQRVLTYLNTRPEVGAVSDVIASIQSCPLRETDLLDLCRRALLCDSLAEEIDRQGAIIDQLRKDTPS